MSIKLASSVYQLLNVYVRIYMLGAVAVVPVTAGAIAEVHVGVFCIGLTADCAFVTIRLLTGFTRIFAGPTSIGLFRLMEGFSIVDALS